jgi:prepilin-type N-terminal cleavage/methylation domain-containing protein
MANSVLKSKSRGFGLTELLVVIVLIGILAGMTMLVMGSNTDKVEATVILAELDAAKSAMLAYSMEHRTRTSDQLGGWDSVGSAVILSSLDKYLESSARTNPKAADRFSRMAVRYGQNNAKIEIGFRGFSADRGMWNALDKKVQISEGYAIQRPSNVAVDLWIRVK